MHLLWWISIISLTGLFIWESYQTIDDFVQQPYVTGLKSVGNSSIELPVIRICPSSWINYTAVQDQNVTLQQLEMLMEGFVDPYVEELSEDDRSYLKDQFNQFIKDRPDFDFSKFFGEIGLKCSHVFYYCRWQSNYSDCCEGEDEPMNNRNPLINAGRCFLIFKRRYNPNDLNYLQTVPGPGGGLLIHMSLPAEESEPPGLAVKHETYFPAIKTSGWVS